MGLNPYAVAVVSAVLFVVMGVALVMQITTATAQQVPGLISQGGITLVWGAMALRFWNRAQVQRRMRRDE